MINAPFKVNSNAQAFQSIYLHPDAEDWTERIVFHKPLFKDEISGVVALKSYRLEGCMGLVVKAPVAALRHLSDHVKKTDVKEGWGKLEPYAILEKLKKAISEVNGVIAYLQDGGESPKENIEGEPAKGKWKPKEVKRGKSVGNFEEKVITGNMRSIYSPNVGVYPGNVSESGRHVWNEVVGNIGEDIYLEESTSIRWDKAVYAYEKKCEELKVNPYQLIALENPFDIEERLKTSFSLARKEVVGIYHQIEVKGLAVGIGGFKAETVYVVEGNVFITGGYRCSLRDTGDVKMVLSEVSDLMWSEMFWVKPLDDRTTITISNRNQYALDAKICYTMPVKEACALLGVVEGETDKIVCGMLKKLTGVFKGLVAVKIIQDFS